MIEINSALQQDKIIALLDGTTKDGITFTYKDKKGLKLVFDTTTEDNDKAAALAKSMIKGESWAAALYFSVHPFHG